MSAVTPPPPATLGELAGAYEETGRAIAGLARGVRQDQLALPTPCPHWTVFDLIAHAESAESMMAGEPVPHVDLSERPWATTPFAQTIESYAASRAGRDPTQLVDHLEQLVNARVAALAEPGAESREVATPFGPMSAVDATGIRVFDLWCHEQDLRETLGVPGGLDSAAASYAVSRLLAAWPRIVGQSDLPDGAVAALEVAGPVSGSTAARVLEVDGDRKGLRVRGFEPTATTIVLTMDTRSATRLLAGRVPVGPGGDFPWSALGEHDLAFSLVWRMAITP